MIKKRFNYLIMSTNQQNMFMTSGKCKKYKHLIELINCEGNFTGQIFSVEDLKDTSILKCFINLDHLSQSKKLLPKLIDLNLVTYDQIKI